MNRPGSSHAHVVRVAFFVVVAAVSAGGAGAQEPAQWSGGLRFGTFSIAAIDPETGEVGVAVTSRVPCVGNVVPHVRAGVGALVTQAEARIEYGDEVLDLLEDGLEPGTALRQALQDDSGQSLRQIGVIAVSGRSAQHTGPQTLRWAGHRSGRNYVTQGNVLVDEDVLQAVARSFESSDGSGRHLADRLIDAIAAGYAEGGDARRGANQSAAVIVADARPGRSQRPDDVTTDINVCEHPEPVEELRRIYNSVTQRLGHRVLQQFYGSDVVQLKVLLHALGYYRPDEAVLRPDATAGFYTGEAVAAVDAFREAEGLSRLAIGTPPGLVDAETVARMWAALERKGLADDVRRRLREMIR